MREVTFVKNISGFSVVELMVSFFIIFLITVYIIPAILFGTTQINEAGEKSKTLYSIQKSIENVLIDEPTGTSHTLQIQFGTRIITVDGEMIEREEVYDEKSSTTKAKIFIPTPK